VLHGKSKEIFDTIHSFVGCSDLGDNVNEEELKAMIDEFDLDGDGESNKTYFLNLNADF
jgi:Ca2+-binding EF-hand superfamily protein